MVMVKVIVMVMVNVIVMVKVKVMVMVMVKVIVMDMIMDHIFTRCSNAQKDGVKIDPSVDCGKWYDLKLAEVRSSTQVPQGKEHPPITGWKEFPKSGIPPVFNAGHIYHHLVESIQERDDDDDDDDDDGGGGANSDFATDKPMRRGKIFYDSGNVTEIQDVRKGSQYFVKAKVLASMRKTTYSVLFSLSVNSGFVSDATCDCRASALGRCSHVAAVLYALSYCVENSSDRSVPCTSKPCTWNRGRKQGKNPKKITETSYPKTHSSSVIQFDPRPLSQQSTAQMPQEEINNFSISLQSCSKNLSMWETLLPVIYDDYVLSEEEKVVLLVKVDQLIENLTPEEQGPVHVVTEQGTDQWHALRALRVTASNAKAIARAHDSTRPTLVQKQLWRSSATTLAMLYGIEHEQDARVDFAQQFTELTVTECGLWLNGKYPGLGASPDGVVYDSSSNSGVLEIKCPISIKTVAPQDFAEVLNYKQQKSFCLASVACENNKYYLKKSHVYYTQIQIQMLILEKEWGYFVIWTPHGLFAEKIPFDSEHVDEIVPRLSDFHKKCLCPEYFEMRLPRRLSLIQLS
ncbi:PREDICTED: uncharacterized protein LOC106811655 [Priapulus caudatus]|uniref:Uncharacterized protein LOC106811655 n=1 Tax=Priapulus caudatus TaxID=37621 RepID=A0ABM1EF71_PRICU|nr:PREDICTED: uncharacterized protein LOC106811655 [Priapulus caudatus]